MRSVVSTMSQPTPRSTRIDRLLTSGIILAAIAAALAIRIAWPYDTVFVEGNVWFREMDAWYHMRLVDSMVHNFPSVTAFDPFSFFPNGIKVPFHPLTSWLIAVPALLLGGGNPSLALVDACGAYFPPVLGALTIIPVYFIGRHLYGRIAGAASAILLAILPGEFLSRSLLGFTDHHVTEAFFSTLTMLLLMLALRAADNAKVVVHSLSDLRNPAYRRTIVYAALAGVSLGLYLLAWRGGVFVLAILVLYVVVRCFIDYGHGRTGSDVVLIFPIVGVIALVIASPTIAVHYMRTLYVLAMLSVVAVPLALRLFSGFGHRLHWSTRTFAAALVGMLALAFVVLLLASPALADYVRGAIGFMVPTGAHLTIMEMHPLFFPGGEFSLRVAWTNFTTALGASLIALALLIRATRRPRGNDVTFFLVWSLVMLAAVMLQRRFGYYYAICAALLCGFLTAWLLSHQWVRRQVETINRRVHVPAKAKSKSASKALRSHQADRRAAMFNVLLATAAIAAVLCVPNVAMARNFATEPGLMTDGWYETLLWMRDNTPVPLDSDAYLGLHDIPPNREPYDYPSTAYGVMAWWDYGHWITRLSHRIPEANPFQQGARTAGRFFMSQSEAEGIAILEDSGCDYVVVDS
ncbi:MAG: oligosaccharyl transferase, archaeosortase A system-associated, partial [Dehalococcoidia bacterium]|nr:oligosaccharyl transferase, archaeosortase A system-associated [Dehalococcoidia bacterium]